MLSEVIKYWGIAEEPAVATPTTWEAAGKYILKQVKHEKAAQNNIRLFTALRTEGIPVPHIYPTRDGRNYLVIPGGCYLLMEKLDGSHITGIFQQDFADIALQTGMVTAKIHRALAALGDHQSDNVPFDQELRGWISETLTAGSMLSADEWSVPIEALCSIYAGLPKQQIHRDLHYGNLLFEGTQLTGVLDFDLGKEDARLFDIAYFLLGQLLGQKDLERVQEKWLIFVRHFLDGYESLNGLAKEEKEALPLMMQCIELLFIAFWQQQGNPELEAEAVNLFRFVRHVF